MCEYTEIKYRYSPWAQCRAGHPLALAACSSQSEKKQHTQTWAVCSSMSQNQNVYKHELYALHCLKITTHIYELHVPYCLKSTTNKNMSHIVLTVWKQQQKQTAACSYFPKTTTIQKSHMFLTVWKLNKLKHKMHSPQSLKTAIIDMRCMFLAVWKLHHTSGYYKQFVDAMLWDFLPALKLV